MSAGPSQRDYRNIADVTETDFRPIWLRAPIAEFYRLPSETPHLEFSFEGGEIVAGISVPKTEAGRRSTYLKVRDREPFAFALASAAVTLAMDGALGGVATRPWRAREAEVLLNNRIIDREIALAAGRAAFADARAGSHNALPHALRSVRLRLPDKAEIHILLAGIPRHRADGPEAGNGLHMCDHAGAHALVR